MAQFSQIPLSCAITSANFTNRNPQRPTPVNLRRCPLMPAAVSPSLSFCRESAVPGPDGSQERRRGREAQRERGETSTAPHLRTNTPAVFLTFLFLFFFLFFGKIFAVGQVVSLNARTKLIKSANQPREKKEFVLKCDHHQNAPENPACTTSHFNKLPEANKTSSTSRLRASPAGS